MDCHRPLLVLLGLVLSSTGCLPHGILPVASDTTAGESDLPRLSGSGKRQPKAATCVKLGKIKEIDSLDPKRSPKEREIASEQARRSYQHALVVEPDYLPALGALAHYYSNRGDDERAAEAYRKALKAHPKEASLWFDLGMCQARQKLWDEAVTSLQTAASIDPESIQYNRTLGFCLARAGRYGEAYVAFKKVGGEAEAHLDLARMLHHVKEDTLSKQHAQLALEINPGLSQARLLLAELDRPAASQALPAADAELEHRAVKLEVEAATHNP